MKLCSVRQKNRFFSFHFMQAQAQNKDAILIIFKTQAFTDFSFVSSSFCYMDSKFMNRGI